MNYPLISEYIEAIKAADDNFDMLTHLTPVLDNSSQPIMSSGNFAVVFKMQDTSNRKLYAVKCFLKEQEDRADSYQLISDELNFLQSSFLVTIKYLNRELFVDSNNASEEELPVVLMDWVEGETLDKYIRNNIHDKYQLSLLAYQFSRLSMWLLTQSFAHGDLKPDNIIVRNDGTLTLVDYDGMYVPAMRGQKARELGSPDFRHPSRTEDIFDEHIDDFSIASIMLSLKAIAVEPELLEEYGAEDRLLLSEEDYRDISECNFLTEISNTKDDELRKLVSLFNLATLQGNLANTSFRLFSLKLPHKSEFSIDQLLEEVTDEDIVNGWMDEYGGVYSIDKKRFLKMTNEGISEYSILKDTIFIEENAFNYCSSLTETTIPNSVTSIGKFAFGHCSSLREIIIPNSVTSIRDWAFTHCTSITEITIPNSVMSIRKSTFYYCPSLKEIVIPNSVKSIGRNAFEFCSALNGITIPKSVEKIDANPFVGCNCKITADSSHFINDSDFLYTKGKKHIVACISKSEKLSIPNSVRSIGTSAFGFCSALTEITIPNSVRSIGRNAFSQCSSLTEINIPNSVKSIEDFSFIFCSSLTQIIIPCSVKSIGKSAFNGCSSLKEISIPSTVTSIEAAVFSSCYSLTKITVPNSVKNIGDSAFSYCSSLKEITIPNSVKNIGKSAFKGCSSLNEIIIPNSVKSIERGVFSSCYSLKEIIVPNSVKSIGKDAFIDCHNLKQIIIPTNADNLHQLLSEYENGKYRDKIVSQ